MAWSQLLTHLMPIRGAQIDLRTRAQAGELSGPWSPGESSPLVSVIVPAYNASGTIRHTLESVMKQDYPNLEVVVVCDGCLDGTAEHVKESFGQRVKVVEHKTNLGLARAYTTGLANTSGPIVMFLQSDCELGSSSWVSKAVVRFDDPRIAWVTGYYETLRPENTHVIDHAFAILRGEMIVNSHRQGSLEPVPFSEGKCDLILREAILRIGGVPLMLRRSGEDQLLSYTMRRHGWRIVKDNTLVVHQHYAGGNPLALLRANLMKEVTHGATQAVINALHWRTILRDLLSPSFSIRKGYHPVFKAGAFAVTVGTIIIAFAERSTASLGPLLGFWGALVVFYLWKCRYSGVKVFSALAPLVIALGFASYIPYGVGLVWGALRLLLMKARVYTRPI